MKAPHIDDFESVEEYEEAERRFDDYVDSKIEERKEEKAGSIYSIENAEKAFRIIGTALINKNTLNELKRLNKEIEGDLKNGN